MRRLAGLCCAALVAILGTLCFPATMSVAGAAPLDDPSQRLAVSIDTFSPRVASTDTKTIKVSGTVRNVGDRTISNLEVRLQAGTRISSDARLMSQLTAPTDPAAQASPFTTFSRSLLPGDTARFSVKVPPQSLGITTHGIYPLQLNVNGKPEYGGTARLLAVNLLLPVRQPAPPSDGGAGITMLWPLVGTHPRLLGTASDGEPLLSDDGIASALRPGGRLYRLVDTTKQAFAAHHGLDDALCFAVDPELLQTVNAMAGGYRVRGSGGGSRAGTGRHAAAAWLAELRGVTNGRCVLPLPYADADLTALARAGAPQLAERATDATAVADTLPDAKIATNVLWPAGGSVNHSTLTDLAKDSPPTVLADPAAVRDTDSTGPFPISRVDGAAALRIDPLVSTALGGLPTDGSGTGSPAGTSTPGLVPATAVPGVRAQNGLAALIYRADFDSGEPAVVAPPKRWRAGTASLSTFLNTLAKLFSSHAAHPVSFGTLAASPAGGNAVALDYSPQAAAAEVPPKVANQVADAYSREKQFERALSKDSARSETPADVVAPVERGLLRATSSSLRAATPEQRTQAADDATGNLDALIDEVTVHDPGRPISLASDDSRIPVSVSNQLPVDVTVHIELDASGGLRAQSIPNAVIPAHSGRTLYIPAKVVQSGWLTTDVELSTPNGVQLGQPARLRLRSSAYGTITIIVTGTAFGLLVLLAGRRIYRRVRAARSAQGRHTGPDEENSSGDSSPERAPGVDVTSQHDGRPAHDDGVASPVSWFGDAGRPPAEPSQGMRYRDGQ